MNSLQVLPEIVRPGPYLVLGGAAAESTFETDFVKVIGSLRMSAYYVTFKVVGSGKAFRTIAVPNRALEWFLVPVIVFSASLI